MVEVLIITISNPLLVGVYKNKELMEEFFLEGKTSDLIPPFFEKLSKEYDIKSISYVNGPGSFMSIKVAYIFLKTFCMVKNINFYSCNAFDFNQSSPIKALGKKYFIKVENDIKVDFLEKEVIIHDFKLPKSIENIDFNEETLPRYNLPAV